jgi:putative nucleotidyltransferase with HDIG domain
MGSVSKDEIIKNIDKLPSFSMTVAKIMQLSNDPKSSPKDIILAISLDPVMTARILGLINSAYFGMREKVLSLNRAVIMLGLNTIKNVAIGSAVISSIKMRNNFKWFTGDQFWEHSLGVAVGAKLLAGRMGVPNQDRDEYFIGGLLHDIGKVVFVQYMADDYTNILDPNYKPGETRLQVEGVEFGIHHAELGGLIAKKWELPPQMVETIREHHVPVFSGNAVDKVKAAVHLADFYCNQREIGIKKRMGMEKSNAQVWQYIGMDEKEVDSVFSDLENKVEEAKVFLKN